MKLLWTVALPLAALLSSVSASAPAKNVPLSVGDQVPDFVVQDLGGKPRRLSDLRKATPSGLVSLTFWCSFCHSCRHMEARLDTLAQSMRGKAAVAALDASAGETAEAVSAFAKSKNLTVPILMDDKGQVADLFGVRVTTTTVVIDRKGILRYRGQFAQGQQALAEALKAVLVGEDVPTTQTALRG